MKDLTGKPFVSKSLDVDSTQAANPYQEAATIKDVVACVGTQTPFEQANLELDAPSSNPYKTVEEQQAESGMRWSEQHSQGLRCGLPNPSQKKVLDKFLIAPDGIYLLPKNPQTEDVKRLCNFTFSILGCRILYQRDGTEISEIRYLVSSHDNEEHTIKKECFGDIIEDILRLYPDCCLSPEAGAKSRLFLREYASELYRKSANSTKCQRVFAYHGWERVDGKMVYLSSSRPDCICRCFVPKIPKAIHSKVFNNGIYMLNLGRQVRSADGTIDYEASFAVILPYFLYLHLGFMAKLIEDAGIGFQFLLLLIGLTGSLKTSLCKATAEPYNPGGMLRLESTPRALELYREESLDMTMLADDIFAKQSSFLKKFEEILRAFGDGVGRAKSGGTEFNALRRTKVRGGCIVTAEHELDSQQSSVLRYVSLQMGSDSIDSSVLKSFQDDATFARQNGGYSIVQKYFGIWIEFLEDHYEELVLWLSDYVPPQFPLRFKRQQEAYFLFCAVAELILRLGTEIGALTEGQVSEYKILWFAVIQNLMKRNEEMAIVAEPWQQFLLTLQQGIAMNSIILAADKTEYESTGTKYLGFKRFEKGEEEYVLPPSQIFIEVKRRLQEIGKDLVANDTAIFRELFMRSLALGYTNQDGRGSTRNRYLKRIKLHGHLVEMLVIPVEKMEREVEKIMTEGK